MLVTGLSSGDIQVGSGGSSSAALAAASAGHDVRIIGSFSRRNSYDFVARTAIKRPEDLRGKKVGVTSIGGGSWMSAMLWLEQLGLEPQRDQITMLAVGDQTVQSQALRLSASPCSFESCASRLCPILMIDFLACSIIQGPSTPRRASPQITGGFFMFGHSTHPASFFSVLIAALILSLSLVGVAAAQTNTSLGTNALVSNTTGNKQHRRRISDAV